MYIYRVIQHHAGIILYIIFEARYTYMKWCEHEFQVYMFDIFAPATIMDMPCFGGDGKLCSNSAVGFWSKWCPLIQAGSGVRLELGGKINIEYQE